jgi:hypothetical protein
MSSQLLFIEIQSIINSLASGVKQLNRQNLNDNAIFLEDVMGEIFGLAYNYEFENANESVSNAAAVDLIDEKRKTVVQVTTLNSKFIAKKTATINKFLKNRNYDGYKSILIFFITQKDIKSDVLHKSRLIDGRTYEGYDLHKLYSKIRTSKIDVKKNILHLLHEETGVIPVEPKEISIAKVVEFKNHLLKNQNDFLQLKYFSNTQKHHFPELLPRLIKQHSPEIRIKRNHLEETNPTTIKNMEVVIGTFASLIQSEKPTFLFGEVGSGKSTIATQFLITENEITDTVNVVLPSNFIKGKVNEKVQSVIDVFNEYIKDNLGSVGSAVNFDLLIKNQVLKIVFDGLDELKPVEARLLLTHLKKMASSYANLTIIGTGRPIELQSIINFNEWNCLSVMDLTLDEVEKILYNEAIVIQKDPAQAQADAKNRLKYIQSRPDLISIATTPLVVCLLRDHLSIDSSQLTLGDLLYKVLKKRLQWEDVDLKSSSRLFQTEYPEVYQRELFISEIAAIISKSKSKVITTVQLNRIVDRCCDGVTTNKPKLVSDALDFFKRVFLQQTGENYSFISQPIYDTCLGIYYADRLSDLVNDVAFTLENWRAIGAAAAILKARAEVHENFDWLSAMIVNLVVDEENTPIGAILVHELADEGLAKVYIDCLGKLDFRPIRSGTDPDEYYEGKNSFSTMAFASAIYYAKDYGFEWFFEEYLNPSHPTHTGESSVSSTILLYWMLFSKFEVSSSNKVLLESVIDYHLTFETFSCSHLLPVISLIAKEKFKVSDRCILFADLLNNQIVYEKVRSLLIEEHNQGNDKEVLNALEIVCSKHSQPDPKVILLWLELNNSECINDQVLATAIVAINNGSESIFDKICLLYGRENFISYLKMFAILNIGKSDSAAMILFDKFQMDDYYLIARPILMQSQWYHGKDKKRKEILDLIIFDEKSGSLDNVISRIAIKEKEVPLLYTEYFFKSLIRSPEIHQDAFLFCIKFLPQYCLTRNPELRKTIHTLVSTKMEYKNILSEARFDLDLTLRNNAVSIKVSCLPEDCVEELECLVFGASQRFPSNDEWHLFMMKLNFGSEVLDHIYSKLDRLLQIPRIFALLILYRNNYRLSSALINEMIQGLLGSAYYFDFGSSGYRNEKMERIMSDPKFFPQLIDALAQKDTAYHAANILFEHFKDKLDDSQLMKVWILDVQQHEQQIFKFDRLYPIPLSDNDFLIRLMSTNSDFEQSFDVVKSRLRAFMEVMTGNEKDWIAFLTDMIHREGRFDDHNMVRLYRWLIFKRKTNPDVTRLAGIAAKQILDFPAIKATHGYRSSVPTLSLIASEFSDLDNDFIASVLQNYQMNDEYAIALGYRIKNMIHRRDQYSGASYIPIFSENKTKQLPKFKIEDVTSFIIHGENLPVEFGPFIRSIIFYGTLKNEQLDSFDNGNLGGLLVALVNFSCSDSISFSNLLSAMEGIEEGFQIKHFSELVYALKEIKLSNVVGRAEYEKQLIQRVLKNDKKFLGETAVFFKELFLMKAGLHNNLLIILFEQILQRHYILDMIMINYICDYVANRMPAEDYKEFEEFAYKNICSLLNPSEKETVADTLNLQWVLALIHFFLTQKNNPDTNLSFLYGLKAIFIQDLRTADFRGGDRWGQFKGKHLIEFSAVLFDKIDKKVVKNVLDEGLDSKMPEVRAICKMITSFN